MDDYITSQTPDKGVQIGPEPPISNDSIALTPDKGVQIGPELLITNASIALTPDKGVQIGPEPPISNGSIAMEPDKGVQIGPEPAISNGSIAMTSDIIPGFAGNLIEAGIVLNRTKSAVYESTAYPANADGTQRPGAVVEYSSEFSVGEGFSVGGVKSELPAGYIRAEFLESEGDAHLIVQENFGDDMGVYAEARCFTSDVTDCSLVTARKNNTGARLYHVYPFQQKWYYGWNQWLLFNAADIPLYEKGKKYAGSINFRNNRKAILYYENTTAEVPLTTQLESSEKLENYWIFKYSTGASGGRNRGFCVKISKGDKIVKHLIPALTDAGVPCMYDKVTKQPFYNLDTVSFIVGLTLPQARNLRKLPTTGGTLTISLPEGYDSDASVMAALETARSKGWTLTIQTYTPENIPDTASTFALRRIWVRKTQDEQGVYVDADGSRWQVDWCVDMITPDGSTPDAYGYEMFRNIDAAVAYWELTPYVNPDAEKEFSQEL